AERTPSSQAHAYFQKFQAATASEPFTDFIETTFEDAARSYPALGYRERLLARSRRWTFSRKRSFCWYSQPTFRQVATSTRSSGRTAILLPRLRVRWPSCRLWCKAFPSSRRPSERLRKVAVCRSVRPSARAARDC